MAVVLATLVLAPTAMVGEWLRLGDNFTFRVGRLWSRLLLKAIGVRVVVRGAPPPPDGRPCIYAVNHQSLVDIVAIAPQLPEDAKFVAKRSLFSIPIFGWAMRAGGFVPIDRESKDAALGSMGRAAEAVREGSSIIFFAEGTRSRTGRLQPFKKGPFHFALSVEVPVVPVAVSGAAKVVRPGSLVVRPGEVTVSFAEPIDVRPYLPGDMDGLREAAWRAVAARLTEDERPEG